MTEEATRPLPVGRRPLTAAGFLHAQRQMRAWAEALLAARRLRGQPEADAAAERLERLLAWHERRLQLSDVAPAPPALPERAAFGVTAAVMDEGTGERRHYTLVGPDEVDPARGAVSHASPVGQALLHKRIGERAFIKRPRGIAEVVVEGLFVDPGSD